ncbi:MAG: coenzyme F420 hydrogenase, partial [Betaproteobacteria bacterium]|nr:coenzyme F420 hydrogenase [Betaproteobacteria bacterium]
IHLRREAPERIKSMVPAHVWRLVEPYGLSPQSGETREGASPPGR